MLLVLIIDQHSVHLLVTINPHLYPYPWILTRRLLSHPLPNTSHSSYHVHTLILLSNKPVYTTFAECLSRCLLTIIFTMPLIWILIYKYIALHNIDTTYDIVIEIFRPKWFSRMLKEEGNPAIDFYNPKIAQS